jgi:hypothetical protein
VWVAVVSQPFDRGAKVHLKNRLDPTLGEFWVDNPWQIVSSGHNLSAYERKRIFWNAKGANFLDISHITGADDDGDGRCAVAADFRNNGRMDVLTRNTGGGVLRLYENNFPQRHYLKVTLRGTKSNRLGIGARLVAHLGDRQVVREMFPVNTFHSQMPNLVHFGLGDEKKVDRLTIRWPSGLVQELTDVPADQHVIITEGATSTETVVPGQLIHP